MVAQRRTLDMTNSAMIARRGAREAALYRWTVTNSLKTPPIAGEQGKSPMIWGYQAPLPEKGGQYFLLRTKMPVNQWLGITGKKQVGRRPKETTMGMRTSNTLKNGNKDLSATEIVHHVS
jgi:hypothetical protein